MSLLAPWNALPLGGPQTKAYFHNEHHQPVSRYNFKKYSSTFPAINRIKDVASDRVENPRTFSHGTAVKWIIEQPEGLWLTLYIGLRSNTPDIVQWSDWKMWFMVWWKAHSYNSRNNSGLSSRSSHKAPHSQRWAKQNMTSCQHHDKPDFHRDRQAWE